MTGDQYVQSILGKYAVNKSSAEAAANAVAPSIRQWAGAQLSSLEFSGSFAKGTANNLSTDVDLFISLRSTTTQTLGQIYESLYSLASNNGWSPRRQNVSIGITRNRKQIDLVPGRVQSGYQNVHSLYKHKTNSWIQTNIKLHIDTITSSYRTSEIRAVKVWRNLHGISFPSFYLELMVIEGLKGRSRDNLAVNVLAALNYIGDNLSTKRLLDPANTNNVISDELTASEKTSVARQAKASAGKQYWKDIIW